ncbi:MAG: hypothetical protein FWG20_00560 [Candidatus Cloacimonetes bacterium]|nr:hypothetical protein [Candidatus Cloacimonadota bacterium]
MKKSIEKEKTDNQRLETPTPNGLISPEPRISSSVLEEMMEQLEVMIDKFMGSADINAAMTGKERMRLFGVKSRKYGFITKAWDIAKGNPTFLPPNFDIKTMEEHIRIFEEVRQLTLLLEQFQHIATDYLMLTSDNAYRDALRVYGSLREQNKSRVPGANALFKELLQ